MYFAQKIMLMIVVFTNAAPLFNSLAIDLAENQCHHRDFGQGSTVCVCNEEHCDNFPALIVTKAGIVQVYETSKSGDRFRPSQIEFSESSINKDRNTQSDHQLIRFDRKKTYQKIIGFGGAFTDSAGFNLAKLSPKLQKRLIQDYYGDDGIQYTVGRIPIGGSDFSMRPYTYDDQVDDDSLSKFQLQPEDFQYKIPYIKMAGQVGADDLKFFASPWSPPAWMKNNHDIRHGGLLKGQPGGKYYKMFAKYFVKFLQAYQQQNVSIWGLTIENEPAAGFDATYPFNCLGLNATLERDFLKLDLGPELYENGFTKDKLAVMIFDDQLPVIKAFTEIVMNDQTASSYVSGIAFHWYENVNGTRTDLDWLQSKYPQIFILPSEACQQWQNYPRHVYLGSWKSFNDYAKDIIEDLNHFASGWIDWNLALDLIGGPNWVGNYKDAAVIVNQTEYYKQPMFYALGHFSKFLAPDSIRLKHQIENNMILSNEIEAVMFQRPDNGTVLIVLNQNQQPVPIQVEDGQRGLFQHALKPDSLTSFLWY